MEDTSPEPQNEEQLYHIPLLTDSKKRPFLFTDSGEGIYICSQIAGVTDHATFLTEITDASEQLKKNQNVIDFQGIVELSEEKLVISDAVALAIGGDFTPYTQSKPKLAERQNSTSEPKEKSLTIGEQKPAESAIDKVLRQMYANAGGYVEYSSLKPLLDQNLRLLEFNLDDFCNEYGLNESQRSEIEEYRRELGDCLSLQEEAELYDQFWEVLEPLLKELFPEKAKALRTKSKNEEEEDKTEVQSKGKGFFTSFMGFLDENNELKSFQEMIIILLNPIGLLASGKKLFEEKVLDPRLFEEFKTSLTQRKQVDVFYSRIRSVVFPFPQEMQPASVGEQQTNETTQILSDLFAKLALKLDEIVSGLPQEMFTDTKFPAREVWSQFLIQWQAPDLDVDKFCKEHGITDQETKNLIQQYHQQYNAGSSTASLKREEASLPGNQGSIPSQDEEKNEAEMQQLEENLEVEPEEPEEQSTTSSQAEILQAFSQHSVIPAELKERIERDPSISIGDWSIAEANLKENFSTYIEVLDLRKYEAELAPYFPNSERDKKECEAIPDMDDIMMYDEDEDMEDEDDEEEGDEMSQDFEDEEDDKENKPPSRSQA